MYINESKRNYLLSKSFMDILRKIVSVACLRCSWTVGLQRNQIFQSEIDSEFRERRVHDSSCQGLRIQCLAVFSLHGVKEPFPLLARVLVANQQFLKILASIGWRTTSRSWASSWPPRSSSKRSSSFFSCGDKQRGSWEKD